MLAQRMVQRVLVTQRTTQRATEVREKAIQWSLRVVQNLSSSEAPLVQLLIELADLAQQWSSTSMDSFSSSCLGSSVFFSCLLTCIYAGRSRLQRERSLPFADRTDRSPLGVTILKFNFHSVKTSS